MNIAKVVAEGVIPPIVTPFTPDGEIDEGAFHELVDFWVHHVQGLFVCGTYGSGPLMSIEQRKRAAEIVTECVNGRLPVIVHVGAADTQTAVLLASHAESIGASAVAAVAPYYYPHSDQELTNYYGEIVNSSSLPVYVYNNPKTTGNSISADLLARLADLGAVGIKDSSFDIRQFYAYMRRVTKPDFEFIIGTEALVLPAMSMGAKAAVSGLANALPEIVVELYQACKDNDYDSAAKLQQKVLELRDIMHLAPSICAVQAMLKMRGIRAGNPKSPFVPISEHEYARIETSLRRLGVL